MTGKGLVVGTCLLLGLAGGCAQTEPGSPEAIADAFADAYLGRADQPRARQYTAFGASKMLDDEVAATRAIRDSNFNPSEVNLDVSLVRGERTNRGERVRFDYAVRFKGGVEKHADVELTKVDGEWKVVRVSVGDAPAPDGGK
ncbi:MAG: hypothetical protein FJ095_12680 [Deltaproteobacteria bacterium]|nr:hypothetical protein [Deltaproteobacteria bacterium]